MFKLANLVFMTLVLLVVLAIVSAQNSTGLSVTDNAVEEARRRRRRRPFGIGGIYGTQLWCK